MVILAVYVHIWHNIFVSNKAEVAGEEMMKSRLCISRIQVPVPGRSPRERDYKNQERRIQVNSSKVCR